MICGLCGRHDSELDLSRDEDTRYSQYKSFRHSTRSPKRENSSAWQPNTENKSSPGQSTLILSATEPIFQVEWPLGENGTNGCNINMVQSDVEISGKSGESCKPRYMAETGIQQRTDSALTEGKSNNNGYYSDVNQLPISVTLRRVSFEGEMNILIK